MARQNIDKVGAFHKDQQDKINDNFTELYGNLVDALLLNAGSVAAAGSSQGDATALAYTVNNVTASDGTKGVILPAAVAGKVVFVYNSVATNGLKIYPATSGTINGGSANAAITSEGKTLAILVATDTTNWAAVFTADT